MASPEEVHQDYLAVSDVEATRTRLKGIVEGETLPTPRELFEVIADVVASSGEKEKMEKYSEGEAILEVGSTNFVASYYRGDAGDPSHKETVFVELTDDASVSLETYADGSLKVTTFDEKVDNEVFIELTPDHGIAVAELLLIGI